MEENETNSELIKKALDDYDKSDIDSQDINNEDNNLKIKKEVNADFNGYSLSLIVIVI